MAITFGDNPAVAAPAVDLAKNSISAYRCTSPGIYDMPASEYHADPCPEPSLSAGMINQILEAPAKCFEFSRRLNQDYQEETKQEKFTIGTVSHIMFLEPHLFDQRVMVVQFDDWRTKEAKALRAEAQAAGKTAIIRKHMDQVREAREVFLSHSFTRQAFDGGRFEQSIFWRHRTTGRWCRARPDFISDRGTHMNDYKATQSANPMNFGKHAYNLGYHRRAAWYMEGAATILGVRPDHYWFCSQEVKPPYLTAVVELDWQALEAGQAENDLAASIFDNCLTTGEWYGYRERDHLDIDMAFRVSLPNYAYYQIDERLGRERGAGPSPPAKTRAEDEWAGDNDVSGIETPPEFDEVF